MLNSETVLWVFFCFVLAIASLSMHETTTVMKYLCVYVHGGPTSFHSMTRMNNCRYKWIYSRANICIWLMSHARVFPLNWQSHTTMSNFFLRNSGNSAVAVAATEQKKIYVNNYASSKCNISSDLGNILSAGYLVIRYIFTGNNIIKSNSISVKYLNLLKKKRKKEWKTHNKTITYMFHMCGLLAMCERIVSKFMFTLVLCARLMKCIDESI